MSNERNTADGLGKEEVKRLIEQDKQCLWHPFTQISEWEQEDILLISHGEGVYLYDVEGRRYLDGVSSLWCNVHGHRHPMIDGRIREQLDRMAHSTFLGLSHQPAIELARRLVDMTPDGLDRVFFSDDGSTAVEAGIKIACQYQQQRGASERCTLAALSSAYHGDTMGSVSMGGMDLFHAVYKPLLFDVVRIPTPAPYYGQDIDPDWDEQRLMAHPAAAQLLDVFREHGERLAALCMEPLVQGAAGMLLHPRGYLSLVRRLCDRYDVLLILDEVATGFGRTGSLFACQQEEVTPDILALAKGLTGGYLPVSATLVREEIFEAFTGRPEEHKTFFHGHTFTANPLGCAAALGNLDVFEKEKTLERLPDKVACFKRALDTLKELAHVGDIRTIGLMAAVDLLERKEESRSYPEARRMGYKVCLEARKSGVIIRPLGDTVVLMPPLAVEAEQIEALIEALKTAILSVCG